MKEYQRKRNNPYQLPHNVYMRVLYHIRDYERMKAERQEILYATPVFDGQPRGNRVSSPTENRAIRLARVDEDCEALEQALVEIPPEYRTAVMNNICRQYPYPCDADYSTYSRWRQRLISFTAKNLGLV